MLGEVTKEGQNLLDNWITIKQEVDKYQRYEKSAQEHLAEVTKRLANWMLPDDAVWGEKVCVWYLDNLIQVEVTSDQPIITIRKRGKRSIYP